ncbi:hypothetical protein GGX14DRAFT_653726 [Mycena pura]|uniref:DUF6534 domain-containing protein n=1 Tax=Mycena pura TaxID=153505 RepID=A0AAD6V4V6_9AGAR|nr:hypothetical protein GGX14DRAFT_653726 [Mycena pura]
MDDVVGAQPSGLNGPSGHSFELMFAPLFFGVILNAMLFGVFVVQVHAYFHMYKTDYPWIRYLIYYLIVLETVNTVCDIGLIYEPLISLRTSPLSSVLAISPKLLAADPVITTLISTPTQLFMAWRIRLVTKSKWLAAVVAFLAFTSLVGGVVATILVALNPAFASFQSIEAPLTLWLTSTAFADLFITAFLVNFLWVNQTGFKTQTDSVADKIIFFTVQTGTLTSFAAIADVTIFLVVQHTTVMFIWDFSLSKLYSICLISTLNARNEWNNLLTDGPRPTDPEKKGKGSDDGGRREIIKIRRATDIQGLQLYIPSQFESSVAPSPRLRTPRSEWLPRPLPPGLVAPKRGSDKKGKGHGRHGHGHGRSRSRDRARDRSGEVVHPCANAIIVSHCIPPKPPTPHTYTYAGRTRCDVQNKPGARRCHVRIGVRRAMTAGPFTSRSWSWSSIIPVGLIMTTIPPRRWMDPDGSAPYSVWNESVLYVSWCLLAGIRRMQSVVYIVSCVW